MTAAVIAGYDEHGPPAGPGVVGWLMLAVSCVGHACIWTAILNDVYGRPLPKWFLKPYRLFTGLVIAAYPFAVAAAYSARDSAGRDWLGLACAGGLYFLTTLAFGGGVLPVITFLRLTRKTPAAVRDAAVATVDYWRLLGRAALGNGKWRWVPRLPGSDVFRVDFTRLTLALPDLPEAWDGVEILLVSDVHFHGTPAKCFFDAVFDRLTAEAPPDLVLFAGDTVDSDAHRAWIVPVLGRLRATAGKFAVLGNHDAHHSPEAIRRELAAAGYEVVGNGWTTATLRGEPLTVIGHEGPWFGPPPDVSAAPPGFRLLVSHSPDNFRWAQERGVNLMVAGHVHGGQIRLPVIGSIFVPSVHGRRYDAGVFAEGGTVMVVGRGLSGKEPLRLNCRPEVVRLKLVRAESPPTEVGGLPG